ncbi:MAG: DUF1987 domain-containing protein [Sphingobacteriaceae bacterium]|nr:DUF1987 domain-containing protein [Sphingobacteriaceae bacterium]
MENLVMPYKKRSPQIDFNTNGELRILGNCFPEDPKGFFAPILGWLEEFKANHKGEVNLTIDLNYVNTSSIKILLELIQGVTGNFKSKAKINWIYEIEDEDMLEVGEDLEKVSEFKFNFQPKTEDVNPFNG